MLKKQTMNLFEAHVEKIVAALAAVILLWVVVFRLMSPPAVELQGETLAAPEAAERALARSEELVRKLGQSSNEGAPPAEQMLAASLFESKNSTFQLNKELYRQPEIERELTEKRAYLLPSVPDLRSIKIDFTRGQASESLAVGGMGGMGGMDTGGMGGMDMGGMGGMDMGGMGGMASRANLKDVDFVTVEATVTMADYINAFQASLKGPDVAKPLIEAPTLPVVAMVLLERRELLPDGQWGNPVAVPFVSANPALTAGALTLDDLELMTPAVYSATLQRRAQTGQDQTGLLQPIPYNLVGDTWKNPSEKERAAETTRTPGAPQPGAGGMDMGGMGGMDMGGMGGMGTGTSGTLMNNELKIWAHDNTVTPGAIYDYRITLGVFNPLYGMDWFGPGQEPLKEQKVLWSRRGAPDKVVQIPPRTIFFPKSASSSNSAEKVASVTVYRYQGGKWYERAYRLLPGSAIGAEEEIRSRPAGGTRPPRPAAGTPATPVKEEVVSVDFRTGVTAIDILPNSKRWLPGSSLAEQVCTDIILRYPDGATRRLGTEKNTWPDDLSNAYAMVQRELRNQRERESRANQPGAAGGMGGMPGRN